MADPHLHRTYLPPTPPKPILQVFVVFITRRYVDLIAEGMDSGLLDANSPEAAMMQASVPDVQLELAAALNAKQRAFLAPSAGMYAMHIRILLDQISQGKRCT